MMKFLAKSVIGLLGVLALGVGGAFWTTSSRSSTRFERPRFTIHEDVLKGDQELGRRIFMVRNACVECHGANLAGVKVLENPAMGSIHGANLTPYGLKDWTDEEVAGAIRYGIHKEGRSLRFMPAYDFDGLSKADVASVIAFIRSVPEVRQESHQNTYGPVARVLNTLGKMPVLYPAFAIDMAQGFGEKPAEGPTVSFGRYLAKSCMGCHGPEFRGGPIAGGDPSWPAAANIRMGADTAWTEGKFRELIATGKSARTGNALRAPMPVALLKQMNDTEVSALWKFLETLK